METLNQLSDERLLLLLTDKVKKERCITLEIIEMLEEIRERGLHLARGYPSLHEFCVRELKYSDGAASRRIRAMKLVQEMPEVRNQIESGSINLTTASQVQAVFAQKAKDKNPLTPEEKTDLLSQIQNQSSRNVERTLARISPEAILKTEKIRAIDADKVKLELVIDQKLMTKLEKLKNLTSHTNATLVEMLENLIDQELKRRDPELKASSPKQNHTKVSNTRFIPSALKHYVWMRDQGCCTYFDPLTKRRCVARHKLTYEHIQAFSMGGETSANNLRLLCANHNAFLARRVFGRPRPTASPSYR